MVKGISPYYIPFLKKIGRKGEFGMHYYVYEFSEMKKLLQDSGFKILQSKFSRYNHKRRGIFIKLLERASLLKNSWSDMIIYKCANNNNE